MRWKKSSKKISRSKLLFMKTKQKFDKLINEFSEIWKNERFIDVSKKQWMRLSLKKEWQDKLIVKIKIYSLDTNDRKVINDIFNCLQTQSKLKFTIVAISFAYSVFFMWTIKIDVRKKRAIMNIRELNNFLVSDVYFVSSQFEIIDDLLECKYLSILDANAFFYQWRVHSNDVYKQTVVTHRDQKTFLIFIMSNRNSMTYVQRQMNILLNDLRKFVKLYINDIICRSKSFVEHLKHLRVLFQIFSAKENHYQFIENLFELSKCDLIKTTSECFRINYSKKEI
jgi:hypothetical protein